MDKLAQLDAAFSQQKQKKKSTPVNRDNKSGGKRSSSSSAPHQNKKSNKRARKWKQLDDVSLFGTALEDPLNGALSIELLSIACRKSLKVDTNVEDQSRSRNRIDPKMAWAEQYLNTLSHSRGSVDPNQLNHKKMLQLENPIRSSEKTTAVRMLAKDMAFQPQKMGNRKLQRQAAAALVNTNSPSITYEQLLEQNLEWEKYASSQGNGKTLGNNIDFHGCRLEVFRSKNVALVNAAGIVLRDTKNTFVILTRDNKTLCLPKAHVRFRFWIGDQAYQYFQKPSSNQY